MPSQVSGGGKSSSQGWLSVDEEIRTPPRSTLPSAASNAKKVLLVSAVPGSPGSPWVHITPQWPKVASLQARTGLVERIRSAPAAESLTRVGDPIAASVVASKRWKWISSCTAFSRPYQATPQSVPLQAAEGVMAQRVAGVATMASRQIFAATAGKVDAAATFECCESAGTRVTSR